MKGFFLSTFIVYSQWVAAQTETDQINQDVWYNFMQAYQDLDASLFNKIHTDDVLRIPEESGIMMIGQEYKDANLENFNRWNLAGVKQKIEFSFYSRIQKSDWAYETGIFKLTRFIDSGSQSYYGKFHVTLRKVSGVWKIYIDSDNSNGGTIGEEDFKKGDILK